MEIGGGGGGERGNGEINKEAPAVGQPMMMMVMMMMVWIIVVAVKRGDTKRKGKGWIEDHSQLSGLNDWVAGKYQFWDEEDETKVGLGIESKSPKVDLTI